MSAPSHAEIQTYLYWSQLLSKEAQRGAAKEILNRVDGKAADRELLGCVRRVAK